jgi:hypothetical protein
LAARKPKPTSTTLAKAAVLVLPALKPRNAVQRAAAQRKAGEHGSSVKAQRKRENDALKKEV